MSTRPDKNDEIDQGNARQSGIQSPPLLGSDGELLVPIPVRKANPLRLLRLPLLIVAALIVTLMVVSVGFVLISGVTTRSIAATQYVTPVDPYVPKEISAHMTLYPSFGVVMGGATATFPCTERHITGHLEATQPGVTVHIWDDVKTLDTQVPVDAQGNYTVTLGIPATIPLHLWVYDSSSQVLSGINNLHFGDTATHPYCALTIDFHKMPS
jgi:hypothetical protein